MPFKFRWPFPWPRRAHPPAAASAGSAAAPSADVSPAAAEAPPPTPVARLAAALPEAPAAPPLAPDIPAEPFIPDLGVELLGRLPALSTPPTLGRLGGLPTMAQTLPTIERFLQTLPVPPAPPALPGPGIAAEFAASLPALAGYGEPGTSSQTPAFPAQLEPPSEPTDVLAPPGGMPGQMAGLSGAAAVLEPARPAVELPVAVPIPARETPAAAASTPAGPSLQRAAAI